MEAAIVLSIQVHVATALRNRRGYIDFRFEAEFRPAALFFPGHAHDMPRRAVHARCFMSTLAVDSRAFWKDATTATTIGVLIFSLLNDIV